MKNIIFLSLLLALMCNYLSAQVTVPKLIVEETADITIKLQDTLQGKVKVLNGQLQLVKYADSTFNNTTPNGFLTLDKEGNVTKSNLKEVSSTPSIFEDNEGNPATMNSTDINYTKGSVGIGITNPETSLQVSSDTNPEIRIKETTANGYLTLQNTQSAQSKIRHTSNSGQALLELDAIPRDSISAAVIRFFREANTSGPVGVKIMQGNGTNLHNHELQGNGDKNAIFNVRGGNTIIGGKLMVGNILNPSLSLQVYDYEDSTALTLGENLNSSIGVTDSASTFKLASYDDNDVAYVLRNSTTKRDWAMINHRQTGDFSLRQDGTDRFNILTNGNVGIGTTNPHFNLHIKNEEGNGIIGVEGQTAGFLRLKDSGGGENKKLFDIISDNGKLLFRALNDDGNFKFEGQEQLVISELGNVGINISNPTFPLEVRNTIIARENELTKNAKIRAINSSGNWLEIMSFGDEKVVESGYEFLQGASVIRATGTGSNAKQDLVIANSRGGKSILFATNNGPEDAYSVKMGLTGNGVLELRQPLGATPSSNPDATRLISFRNKDKTGGETRVLDIYVDELNHPVIRGVGQNIKVSAGNEIRANFHADGRMLLNGMLYYGKTYPIDGTGVINGSQFKGVDGELYWKRDNGIVKCLSCD